MGGQMTSIAAMPKYEAYKDSGVEWLGEIPESWKIKRLKFVLDEVNERSLTGSEVLLSLSKSKGIIPRSSLEERSGGASSLVGYKKVSENQLVINKMQAVNGLLAISSLSGITSPDYSIYSSKDDGDLDIKYLCYLLLQPEYLTEFKKRVTGVMEGFIRLYTDDLYDIFAIIPCADEQNQIATFLDIKTTQIDDAIATKEQQINLLKERKQIIIQKAVTQGLDPNVPMKNSGVDWIGKIPEHWKIRRAKYLFNEADERSQSGEEELLSVSHLTGVTPRSEKNVTMFMSEDYSGSKLCRNGDLVMNIMWTWMGALGVSDRSGIVSPAYGVYRQKNDNTFNPKYLEFLLKTTNYIEHYNKVSSGLHSSRLRFYGHMFFDMKLGFPSYDEQNKIIIFLDEQLSKIENVLTTQAQQIQKLKEYKTTLINSAVTGKIKVTDLQPTKQGQQ